jgi:hypothetical protein
MNQPKSFLLFVFASICLVSCNAKPTLQTYFVDHQETPNFISMDVPVSFLGTDDIQMTEIQRQAINSIDKLNMLGYSLKSGNIDVFNAEVGNVKALLKDKRYNELLRLGNQKDGRVKISYIGDDDTIDELVVFGRSNTYGFAIIRVLGDNMDIAKIMELGPIINILDTKDMNVEGFMDFML